MAALTPELCDLYIAQLESSLATGFASITRNGQTVQYSTVTQIKGAIDYFRAQKALLLGAGVTADGYGWPAHRRIVRYSSGLASSRTGHRWHRGDY